MSIYKDIQVLWVCRKCNKIIIADSYPFECEECDHPYHHKAINFVKEI